MNFKWSGACNCRRGTDGQDPVGPAFTGYYLLRRRMAVEKNIVKHLVAVFEVRVGVGLWVARGGPSTDLGRRRSDRAPSAPIAATAPTARETGSNGALVYADSTSRDDPFGLRGRGGGDGPAGNGSRLGGADSFRRRIAARRGAPRMPPGAGPRAGGLAAAETLLRWGAAPLRGRAGARIAVPRSSFAPTRASSIRCCHRRHHRRSPTVSPVVGLLKFGDLTLRRMDRPGSFATDLDTRGVGRRGAYPVSATLCDGWDAVSYALGNVEVLHTQVPE